MAMNSITPKVGIVYQGRTSVRGGSEALVSALSLRQLRDHSARDVKV